MHISIKIFVIFCVAAVASAQDFGNREQSFRNFCSSKTAFCTGNKENCIDNWNCDYAVGVKRQDNDSNRYDFMLMGSDRGYVAVGLSHDGIMGEDSIVECIRPGLEGTEPKIRSSWSPPATSGSRDPVKSEEGDNVVIPGELAVYRGRLYCSFSRQARSVVNGKTFDLNNEHYYLLLAQGKVINGKIQYHAQEKVTSELVDFKRSSGDHGGYPGPDRKPSTTTQINKNTTPKTPSKNDAVNLGQSLFSAFFVGIFSFII